MIHLENSMNIMFAPGTLRIYYRGSDQTAIIGKKKKKKNLSLCCFLILFFSRLPNARRQVASFAESKTVAGSFAQQSDSRE